MNEIVVIGSLNMDLVVLIPRLPQIGETISGKDLKFIPGGKGANQAAGAALLGTQVMMIGRVGQDAFGSRLTHNLNDYGVDTSGVLTDPNAATGTAIVMVEGGGDNAIMLSPGANGRVCAEDIDRYEQQIAHCQLVVLQLEIPTDAVAHAVDVARRHGVPVLLNPAPAAPALESVLKSVTYLIPNETEASSLSGIPITDRKSAEEAAKKLLGLGVHVVVITLGKNGCLLMDRTQTIQTPAPAVDVVDTTAAGDAFIACFASEVVYGHPLQQAIRIANNCGALTCTRPGAQTSLPSVQELEDFSATLAGELGPAHGKWKRSANP